MGKNDCIQEKRLYLIAMLGAVVCFISDNLLGYFTPAADFGNKLLSIHFSYEWADSNPYRFVVAGLCGVVSLLMMFAGFYGIHMRLKEKNDRDSKLFLCASFVFVSVGILYHNVFAVTAYTYNRLIAAGIASAKEISLDVFNTFILVSALAAVGYACMAIIMFISSIRGELFKKKWMCIVNPFVSMVICVVLSNVLPQTAFVNGVFGLGQQSIGLFIVFCFCFACDR